MTLTAFESASEEDIRVKVHLHHTLERLSLAETLHTVNLTGTTHYFLGKPDNYNYTVKFVPQQRVDFILQEITVTSVSGEALHGN